MQWLRMVIEMSFQFTEGPWLHRFAPTPKVLLDFLLKRLMRPCCLSGLLLLSEWINAAGNFAEFLLCKCSRFVRRQVAVRAKGAHALDALKAKANVIGDRIALAAHTEALHHLPVAVVPQPLACGQLLHRALRDPPEHVARSNRGPSHHM